MSDGNVQLRLQASLDLAFLRAQVASIGKSLETPNVAVVATLRTDQLQKDIATLGREIRININDSQVVAARLRLGKLSQSLATLRRATASPIEIKVKYIQEGKTPAGLASEKRGTFRQRLEAVNPAEIKRLYQSAAEAGIVAFDQQTARSKSKIVTSLSRAGEDAIGGLLNGVKSKNADVRAAAKGLGDDLIRAFKNSLDIASPSKRARDEIGKPVGQGIEQGVEESLKKAQSLNLADLRRYFNALKSEAKEGSAQLAALIAAGMAGMVQLPGGRQQRARIQQAGANVNAAMTGAALGGAQSRRQTRQEQSASAAAVTPAFLASLPLLMGMKPQELQQRMLGLHGQQYRAPGIGGFTRPNERRINGLIEMLASARGGLGAGGGALVARGPAGAMPSILPTGYRNAALPPSMVNYPPGMPAAYTSGFTGTSVGRFGMARASMEEPKVMGIFAAEVNRAVSAVKGFRQSLAKQAPALPPAGMTGLSAAQARRVEQAYRRSEERGAAVRAESMAALSQSPWGDGTVPARSYFAYGQGPQIPGFPLQPRLPGSASSGFRDAVVGGGGGGFPSGGSGGGGGGSGRGGALAPYAQRTDLPSGYIAGAQMARALGNADQYLRQSRVPLAGAIAELSGEFAQVTKQVLLYGTAYKALAFFVDLPNQALNAATALQTFRNQLNAVTGSADNANRSFSFVDGLAERFAVPLASVRQGFVRMYASMEPAGFGANEIEGLFSGISKAAATFGMSREQVDRVAYAFSQMASKGQIMAEELRGQLGDVLPGSLALFAKAAQMELPEFTKAMEDGRFSGEAMRVVLNNVAILLNQQFAKGADGAANTLQGALNQMQNSLQRLYEAFEPLVAQVAQRVFPLISSAINDATAAVKAFAASAQGNQGPSNMLSSGARGIYDAMKVVEEVVRAVGGVLQQLTPTLATVGRSIAFVIEQLARLTNTPIGAFLANWLLQTTLLVGALQLLAKAGILKALAALVRFNGGIGIAIQRLKLLIFTSNTARLGLIALGGGLVLAALSSLTQHLEGVYNKMLGIQQAAKNSAQAIAAMSQTEATVRARSVEGEIATLKRLQQSTKGVTGGMVSASATEITALARAGASPGVAFTGPLLDEAKGTYGAGFVDPTQVGAAILKLEDDLARLRQQARPVEMPSAALQDIPPGAGDAEAAAKVAAKKEKEQQEALERAQRETENYARQQAQLITATADFQSKQDESRFQHLESLAMGELDHAKAMIDAKHDYEIAGANEIHTRQLRYYKEQKDIQLRNVRSVRDAIAKIRESEIRLETARRVKVASEQAAMLLPTEGATATSTGANANLTGYLTRLSYLETRLKNVPNAEGSGAMGFFQTKGPFHGEATAASGGKNSRSANFTEASQAVASWIQKHRPEAYSAILAGQFDKADAILRVGTWPSLPGGAQAQPSAVQAQARQYLPGGALAAPSAPALPASRPMPSLKKGGVFQGFPVTGVPGENRAYRGGTHEGYDIATPMNTALSYAIGGIVKRINNVGKGNIGKMVEVELENGVIGLSGHLNEVLVRAGQRFTANQIIARTGDTGAGGIHLHQESAPFGYKKGRAAESMAYLQLGGARVPGAAASGPRHSMAKAGQEASFDVELAKLELANVKAENIKKVIQELSIGSEQLRASLAAQVAEVFPVKQMELEAALMEQRNQLVMAGAPSEYIEAQQSIAKGDMERVVMLQYMTERLGEIKAAQEGFTKEIAKGGPYVDFFKGQLKDAEASAKLYKDAIAGAEAEQQRFNLITLEGALAELKNADALKAMQEAVGMVKSAVEGVMGSYKNFVGEVLKGGSLKDAAKRLQEALRDQAVTMFLDFAMKPMQKFLEDSLLKVFGLESEEQQRQKSLAKLQEQINLLSQIRDNTAQGGTRTNPGTTAVGGTGASDFIPLTGGLGRAAVDAPFGVDVRSMVEAEEGIRATSESMYQLGATMPALGQGVGQLTQNFATSAMQSGAAAKTWQQSLGATVQSIGMAAGAVMSIAGGVSQIKEGGVSGVLGGIGSIFMGIGGALGGFGGTGGLGSLFGGGAGAAGGFAASGPLASVGSIGGLSSGFSIPGFANGAIVNGPTLGLVGEGKYNEAIVPLPDGRSIPVKMAGGQSAREAMSNGGMPSYAPSIVSFSFESTKINGVEYVSRDQLELAMASTRREAIKEGAKRGMGMTLDKIQQSPGTRRSIAMGRR